MNNLPEKLLEKQELQRQQTLNLVLRAINELKSEGHSIKIKLLMEHTGLSRSTFAKKHIRDVLVHHGIVSNTSDATFQKSYAGKSTIQNLKNKIKHQEEVISELRNDKQALKTECEFLRGKIFLLLQRQQTD